MLLSLYFLVQNVVFLHTQTFALCVRIKHKHKHGLNCTKFAYYGYEEFPVKTKAADYYDLSFIPALASFALLLTFFLGSTQKEVLV